MAEKRKDPLEGASIERIVYDSDDDKTKKVAEVEYKTTDGQAIVLYFDTSEE